MPIVVPAMQNKAWVSLVQQVVWAMVVVQGMVTVMVECFEVFVEIIAYFIVPFVATQN